jgi:hypothetical protein
MTAVGCSGGDDDTLRVYRGRHYGIENAFAQFTEDTGIEVEFLTGNDAELRERIEAEGDDTDADGLGNVDVDRSVLARPDDIGFTADAEGSASVVRAEFRGASWCYTLELASGETVRSMRSHIAPVAVGTTVRPALVSSHRPVLVDD